MTSWASYGACSPIASCPTRSPREDRKISLPARPVLVSPTHGGYVPGPLHFNKFLGGETEYFTYPKLAKKKKVLVAGAGPAGLEAARVSALRGHEVVLYSKDPIPGWPHEHGQHRQGNLSGRRPEDRYLLHRAAGQTEREARQGERGNARPSWKGKNRTLPSLQPAPCSLTRFSPVLTIRSSSVISSFAGFRISHCDLSTPATLSRLTEFWVPIGSSVLDDGRGHTRACNWPNSS